MLMISPAAKAGLQSIRLYSSWCFFQSSGHFNLQYTPTANIKILRYSVIEPWLVMTSKQQGPSVKCSRLPPKVISFNSEADTLPFSTAFRNSPSSIASDFLLKQQRIVSSELKYGMLIKLPTSPRSDKILSCFGKISHPENPSAIEISIRYSRTNAAGSQSFKKRNRCAPPDLDRHWNKGSFNLRILSVNPLWSRSYVSISNAPNLHMLSLLIGIDPIPWRPSICDCTASSVKTSRATILWASALPLRPVRPTVVRPCATLEP